MTVVLAVDPGAVRAGIAAADGRDLAGWRLVERDDGMAVPAWARHVVDNAAEVRSSLRRGRRGPVTVAVESVVEPTPHMGLIAVRHLLVTAVVYGAVLDAFRDCVTVRPAGFSKTATQPKRVLERVFPAELVSTPVARLKDVRAAWLVAEAAQLRIRALTASQR